MLQALPRSNLRCSLMPRHVLWNHCGPSAQPTLQNCTHFPRLSLGGLLWYCLVHAAHIVFHCINVWLNVFAAAVFIQVVDYHIGYRVNGRGTDNRAVDGLGMAAAPSVGLSSWIGADTAIMSASATSSHLCPLVWSGCFWLFLCSQVIGFSNRAILQLPLLRQQLNKMYWLCNCTYE